MAKKKLNRFWALILILNPIASLALGLWVFSLPGTLGLVRWDSFYRLLVGLVLSLGLWAPVLWVVGRLFLRKRKWLAKIWGVGVAALSAAILAFTLGAWGYLIAQPMLKSGDKPPVLLVSSHSGAAMPDLTLAVWTKTPQQLTASLGSETEPTRSILSDSGRVHRLLFPKLQPERVYTYQLEGGESVSFRALPDIALEGSKPMKVVFSSDVHYGSSKSSAEKTTRMMDQWLSRKDEIDLFCLLGDITELGFMDSDWQDALDSLSPVFSQIPMIPVIGNHDLLFQGYRHYLDYLHPEGRTSFEDLYRRVDIGPVHFLLLNAVWGTEDVSREQLAWLEAQLASIPKDHWKVVLSHAYYYASGSTFAGEPWYDNREMIRIFGPIFEKRGVDLVVSGHNHLLEVLEHAGVTYAVVGVMGAPLDTITYRSPASVWCRDVHGWMEVTWTAREATLQFFQWDGVPLFSQTLTK
ncbi:MAG TPA: metallophosphoesterase [Thermotogota bacterium]|jgi:UDP-2,3-diacylglucosamine pyrophosphatase LpxH|nr:metallophosphoesterase [Thermotogota bacterium]NLH18875.1 hypothetical protein [Thermotogaceae bacterium]OQC30739.1 MAG: Calcineurin-like phosphoesterase [Thermotogota bacterium ADurb.Bin062]HNY82133.1 metallophosphoesterase [Thermotogota bacterium]HOD91967.1 metallophosphoesterase [Thermotogota bacterium]